MNDRRLIFVAAAVACLAVLAGGWLLLVSPAQASISSLRQQATSQEATNLDTRTKVTMLQALARSLPAANAELAKIEKRVPQTEDLPDFIRQMSVAATNSGLSWQGLTPSAPVALPGTVGLSEVDVSILVQGDYSTLELYLSHLESLQRIVLVSGMSVTGVAAATGSTGSGTGTGTGSAGSGDTLKATINGRILVRSAAAAVLPAATGTTPAAPVKNS